MWYLLSQNRDHLIPVNDKPKSYKPGPVILIGIQRVQLYYAGDGRPWAKPLSSCAGCGG